MSQRIGIILVIVLALVAAMVITVVLHYYQSNKTPQMAQGMATSTAAKLAILGQISPPQPAPASAVAKESETLNAVSRSSSGSTSTQYKLDVLSQMSQ